jgi:preprotein translocase subunit SecD
MNRYALWKYIVIAVALLLGAIYTLPNFYGESPAVQVSSGKSTVKIDPALITRVESVLKDAQVPHEGLFFDTLGLNSTLRVTSRTPIRTKARHHQGAD